MHIGKAMVQVEEQPPPGHHKGLVARALTKSQVDIETNPRARKAVIYIVMLVTFLNLAGTVILQPFLPMMCVNAEGATAPPNWPANYTHPQAFPAGTLPQYQFAVTLIMTFFQLGGGAASVWTGMLSDKIGRKPVMLWSQAAGAVFLALYCIRTLALQPTGRATCPS